LDVLDPALTVTKLVYMLYGGVPGYATFTHASLTTRCRTKSLYKSIFCIVKVTQYHSLSSE